MSFVHVGVLKGGAGLSVSVKPFGGLSVSVRPVAVLRCEFEFDLERARLLNFLF